MDINSFNQKLKALLSKSRSKIEQIQKLVDEWEVNALLNDQMEILATMEKMLPNQSTQVKDPVRSSRLRPKTTTVTTKDHQRNSTTEISNQSTKKRKLQQATDSDDEDTAEVTDKYDAYDATGDAFRDRLDYLNRKKQRKADWRCQSQN